MQYNGEGRKVRLIRKLSEDGRWISTEAKMSYRFFRNSLIKVGILSVGICAIFYDALTGKNVGSPATLILLAALVVIGNGWLTYMMFKAKKREQEMLRIGDNNLPSNTVVPATRAKRKRERSIFLAFLLVCGLALIVMGFYGWSINFIPAYYLGAFFLIFALLGLCGINIWKGGPYDPIHDPVDPEPPFLVRANETSSPGVWPPPPCQPSG